MKSANNNNSNINYKRKSQPCQDDQATTVVVRNILSNQFGSALYNINVDKTKSRASVKPLALILSCSKEIKNAQAYVQHDKRWLL